MHKAVVATLAVALVASSMPGVAAVAAPATTAPNGKSIFLRCVACHTLDAAAPPRMGPHLEAIVGRKAATVAGYDYSAAMRGQTFVWTEARLDKWLKRPQAMLPGVCMPFTGLARKQERKALITYLKRP